MCPCADSQVTLRSFSLNSRATPGHVSPGWTRLVWASRLRSFAVGQAIHLSLYPLLLFLYLFSPFPLPFFSFPLSSSLPLFFFPPVFFCFFPFSFFAFFPFLSFPLPPYPFLYPFPYPSFFSLSLFPLPSPIFFPFHFHFLFHVFLLSLSLPVFPSYLHIFFFFFYFFFFLHSPFIFVSSPFHPSYCFPLYLASFAFPSFLLLSISLLSSLLSFPPFSMPALTHPSTHRSRITAAPSPLLPGGSERRTVGRPPVPAAWPGRVQPRRRDERLPQPQSSGPATPAGRGADHVQAPALPSHLSGSGALCSRGRRPPRPARAAAAPASLSPPSWSRRTRDGHQRRGAERPDGRCMWARSGSDRRDRLREEETWRRGTRSEVWVEAEGSRQQKPQRLLPPLPQVLWPRLRGGLRPLRPRSRVQQRRERPEPRGAPPGSGSWLWVLLLGPCLEI